MQRKPLLAAMLVAAVLLTVFFFPRGDEPLAYDLMERGRYAEAAAQFEKLLEQDPHNRQYKWLRARALFKAEELEAWSKLMEELVQYALLSNTVDLVEEYAFYKYELGDWHSALEFWQLADKRGYVIERPQYPELLATLALYGYINQYELKLDAEDPLHRFIEFTDEFSSLSSAFNSYSWQRTGAWGQVADTNRIDAVAEHIVWLRAEDNLNQLPEGLQPYAQELADNFEALQVAVHWQREGELVPQGPEQVDRLIYYMDYDTLALLPWGELVVSFPDLPSVTYYSHWFEHGTPPYLDVVLTVEEIWRQSWDNWPAYSSWSADGQWLAMSGTEGIFHPGTRTSRSLDDSFWTWSPKGSGYLLVSTGEGGRQWRIAEAPGGAEYIIDVSSSSGGEAILRGQDGELNLSAAPEDIRIDYYSGDALVISAGNQYLLADFGLAAATEIVGQDYARWRYSWLRDGFRLIPTAHGREIRDYAWNYLGSISFPGHVDIAGSEAGRPVLFSQEGQRRVWVAGASGFSEHILPAHLEPIKWLRDDRVLCLVRHDIYQTEEALHGGIIHVVYSLQSGEIELAELPQGLQTSNNPDYVVWRTDSETVVGRLQWRE